MVQARAEGSDGKGGGEGDGNGAAGRPSGHAGREKGSDEKGGGEVGRMLGRHVQGIREEMEAWLGRNGKGARERMVKRGALALQGLRVICVRDSDHGDRYDMSPELPRRLLTRGSGEKVGGHAAPHCPTASATHMCTEVHAAERFMRAQN